MSPQEIGHLGFWFGFTILYIWLFVFWVYRTMEDARHKYPPCNMSDCEKRKEAKREITVMMPNGDKAYTYVCDECFRKWKKENA